MAPKQRTPSPGPGKGLTEYHFVRQAERLADDADLVLEQQLERLHEREAQVLRQTADVVVRLYAVALEDVG